MAAGRVLFFSFLVLPLCSFCFVCGLLLLSNTFYFGSYFIINADNVSKVINRSKWLYSCNVSLMFSIRHIGYLYSIRKKRYFGSRVPYSVNSILVLSVVRLCLVTSGDIDPNPGPRISSSTTIHSGSHRNESQNLSNLVRINSDADHHPRSPCRTLTVSSLNARSIKNKSAMFDDYLYDCKADLFAITETWLSVKVHLTPKLFLVANK